MIAAFKFVLGVVLLGGCLYGYTQRDFVREAFVVDETTEVVATEELAGRRASATQPATTTTSAAIDLYVAKAEDTRGITVKPVSSGVTIPSIELTGGSAILGGVVVDDFGTPIPKATVRVERLIDGFANSVDIQASDKGTWRVEELPGGRYRLRAFAPPNLSQVESAVFFLSNTEERTFSLPVSQQGGLSVSTWASDSGWIIGQTATIGVRVQQSLVDEEGKVRLVGSGDTSVRLGMTGPITGFGTRPTNADGTASWTVRCMGAGPITGTVYLGTYPYEVRLPTCSKPAPTTTTTRPPTTQARTQTPTTRRQATVTTRRPATVTTRRPTTTRPPATRPPTTRPPTTQPPATQPPATQAPTTQPPATQPPTTQPPTTQAPTTQAPTTQPPTTQPPTTQAPTTTTTAYVPPPPTTAASSGFAATTSPTAAPTTTTTAPPITVTSATTPTTTAPVIILLPTSSTSPAGSN